MFADDIAIFIKGGHIGHIFCTVKVHCFKSQDMARSKTKFMPSFSHIDRGDTLIQALPLHECGDINRLDCGCDTIDRMDVYKYLAGSTCKIHK